MVPRFGSVGPLDRHSGCLARLAGGDTGKAGVGTRQLLLSLYFPVDMIHLGVHT